MTEKERDEYMSNQLMAMVNRATAIIKKDVADCFEVTFEYEKTTYRIKLEKRSKNWLRRFFQDF